MNITHFLPTKNETIENLTGVCCNIERQYEALVEQARRCAESAASLHQRTSVSRVASRLIEGHSSSQISISADAAAASLFTLESICRRTLDAINEALVWARDLIKQAAGESLSDSDQMNLTLARMVLMQLEKTDRLKHCTPSPTARISTHTASIELPVRRHFKWCRTALTQNTEIQDGLRFEFIRDYMATDMVVLISFWETCDRVLEEFRASIGREAVNRQYPLTVDVRFDLEALAATDESGLMRDVLNSCERWTNLRAEKVRREVLSLQIAPLLDRFATMTAEAVALRDADTAPVVELANLITAMHELSRARVWISDVTRSTNKQYNGRATERELHHTIQLLYEAKPIS